MEQFALATNCNCLTDYADTDVSASTEDREVSAESESFELGSYLFGVPRETFTR